MSPMFNPEINLVSADETQENTKLEEEIQSEEEEEKFDSERLTTPIKQVDEHDGNESISECESIEDETSEPKINAPVGTKVPKSVKTHTLRETEH